MDKGEGFDFGPVRGLVGTGLRLKFEDDEEEDDGDETPDDTTIPVELSTGFDSRIGGGVSGDSGGGEGSGERVLRGERILGRGDRFLGDIGIGDLDRGRLYSSSLRCSSSLILSSSSSSLRLRLASSDTRCKGAEEGSS